MTPDYEHVFFDLDGTLVDNFKAIHSSFAYAADKTGNPSPSYQKVLKTVGGSVPITASKLFPGADSEEISAHFENHFEQVMLDGLHLLDGAEWLLNSLNSAGVSSVVFTNKTGYRAREICRHLGIDTCLKGIVGTGDTPYRKPDKLFSEHVLKTFHAKSETSCLVGDSPFDEMAARVVNMPCFLVSTGSHDRAELEQHTQSPVYGSLRELGQSVFGLSD